MGSMRSGAYDNAGIAVLHVFLAVAGPSPHLQICPRKEGGGFFLPQGQVVPGDRRMLVMHPVPVVVQPEEVDRRPDAEVPGAP
jgi:hypothetical protein